MKKLLIIIMFIAIFLLSVVSASDYYIEFNQIQGDIVIEEGIDGIKISKYIFDEGLERSREGYYFIQKIEFNESYDNAKIKLNLDKGFILDRDTIFPENYEIESDGQIISVVWEIDDVKKDSVFAIFVSIIDTRFQYEILIISVLIIVVLVIGYYIYFRRKKSETRIAKKKVKVSSKEDKRKIIESHLLESEIKVITELKKAKRKEMWQKELEKKTEFSKAKLSRVIHNLEERNLIIKTPFGNTNKIKLK